MSRTTRLYLATGAALVVAVAIVITLVRASSGGDVEVRLGDDVFRAGNVDALARRAPVLFQDLLSDGTRDLVLFHSGDDPGLGWEAVEVTRGDGCGAEQDRSTLIVRDGCIGAEVVPGSGDRPRYPARVDGRTLVIDLRPGATTAP